MIIPRSKLDAEVQRRGIKLLTDGRALSPRWYASGGPIMRNTGTGELLIPIGMPARAIGGPIRDRRKDERVRAESCAQTEPFFGRTPAEAAENLRIELGHCPHGLAEEVRLSTGEVVAAVCPTCLEALPASFVGSDWRP